MDNIKNTFKWYEQFNNLDTLIKTQNNEFEFIVKIENLPHLLRI